MHYHVHLYKVVADEVVSPAKPKEVRVNRKVPILKHFKIKLKQKVIVDSTDFERAPHLYDSVYFSERDSDEAVCKKSARWTDRIGSASEMQRVSTLAANAKDHFQELHSPPVHT